MRPSDHADAGGRETDVPADALAEISADERGDERAGVDPHVEDRVTRRRAGRHSRPYSRPTMTLTLPFRRPVPMTISDEAEIEGRERGDRHAEVAGGDQDPADEHGPLRSDQPVGDPAAGQRHHVHHRGVQAVDGARRDRVEAQPARRGRGGHEQDEQRAHPVVAEALPHLGEEQRREAARMAEERAIALGREVATRSGAHGRQSNRQCDRMN